MPGETVEVGHIVVVDDDAMVLQTITNYLEEHNVPVASVPCRQDLNRHLEKAHPSLILLDLRLGKRTAWKSGKCLRVFAPSCGGRKGGRAKTSPRPGEGRIPV